MALETTAKADTADYLQRTMATLAAPGGNTVYQVVEDEPQ
jgi:hypothetical protein